MDNILLNINEIYSEILKTKSLIKEQEKKIHLFGGARCSWGGGPSGHASFTPKTWQVNRAWDIMGAEGTRVYAIENGVITRVEQKKHNPQTKEYGYSIEMNSDGDKIYYTHLSSVGPKIQQGSKITQGDLLGTIGKPPQDPNWSTHVHIALESGDIGKLIDSYCNIIKKGSESSTGGTSNSSGTTKTGLTYGNKSFADLVLGDKFKFESVDKTELINEITILAPVPVKSDMKSNFGEKRSYETHPGVDIPIPVGTKVLAPMDGVVELANFNYNGLCGATIDIDYKNGFWSRFCHMSRIDVQKGDVVKQGQVVGLSGGKKKAPGAGNSGGPHLHFTLKENGKHVDPIKYINKSVEPGNIDVNTSSNDVDGEIDYSSGIKALTTSDSAKQSSGLVYGSKEFADFLTKTMDIKFENEIKEEKVYGDFGKSQQSKYGSITLPKEKNDKIKSPVEGLITRGKYNASCPNQISISHDMDGEKYILEYCGISSPSVRAGNKVSKGSVLGKTDTDVTISLFDDSGSRVYIDNFIKKEITKTEKLISKGIKSEPNLHYGSAWGRILGNILATPVRWFEDQYDERGDLKQKRWSSPTDKIQPDDWIAQGSPTYSKKLKEQIEKIKRIL